MKAPAFIDAHETLYATASQRAKDALDSLVAAIRERDMLAEDVLHRRILTPHGWAGLTFHSSHLEAYVTANVADDDALAWQIVTDALSSHTPSRTRSATSSGRASPCAKERSPLRRSVLSTAASSPSTT